MRRKLHSAGFVEISQKGSHVKFMKVSPVGTRIVIVPRHSRDVPRGTLRSILNQAGLTPDAFEK
ncbi:MAG: type II toxin-antitoxin system HicA family toxin [Planctomycetes bacterium]|nr:type II toxin-antitoxin system HicA family toxin [Planctomycetota bacterium]